MRKITLLLFALSLIAMTPSCNVNKGLSGLTPEQALTGVQTLLGGASKNALKGFAGNVLSNAIMQKAMPKEFSKVTNALSKSREGTKALGLLNDALGSAMPAVATSLLGKATNGIPSSEALNLLKGSKTGATDFLKSSTGKMLTAALVPVITKKLTDNGGLGKITSALGSQASSLLGNGKLSLVDLATTSAVDGLFAMMGNAEKAERSNPTDPLMQELFGK